MNVGRISVDMKPVNRILQEKGLTPGGKVQTFHTANVMRRITRYMPRVTGNLIKQMILHTNIQKPEIVVKAPQAAYLYFGKVMVNAKTGKGPMNIPGVGLRYKKGTTLKQTNRELKYNSKNPQAGPYWDRRLKAAESRAMAEDLQRYINRG